MIIVSFKRQRDRGKEINRYKKRQLPRGLRYPEEKDGTNQYQGGDASQVPVPVTQTVRQTYAINVHVSRHPVYSICTVFNVFPIHSLNALNPDYFAMDSESIF